MRRRLHAKAARLPWPGRCPLGVSGIAIVQHVGDDQGRAWPGGWRHAAPPGPGHVRPHRPEEPRPVPGLHGRARPRRALHGAGAQGKDCGRPRPVICACPSKALPAGLREAERLLTRAVLAGYIWRQAFRGRAAVVLWAEQSPHRQAVSGRPTRG